MGWRGTLIYIIYIYILEIYVITWTVAILIEPFVEKLCAACEVYMMN